MKIENLDKIYIIHYVKLTERRAYLEKRLNELGLASYAAWVVSDKEGKFSKKELAMWESNEKTIQERKKYLGDKLPPIGKIDMIMMLQHLQILKKIASQKNEKVSLIFEDDVLLDDDFCEKLNETIKKLRYCEWDICYSDKGSLLVEPKINKKDNSLITLYESPDRRSNTTGSYLITPKRAKKLLILIKKIAIGPDMELTYVQKKNNLNVLWTVPFLTHQGSIEEVYQSNVRNGSLAGKAIRITNKIGKISPGLAKLFARVVNSFIGLVYRSKFLFIVKDKFKRLIGLN
jgi:GR25 family glycosyltransferase involved in LPS biosynthesis